MRILVVSAMYPGLRDPDLGVFVKDTADALRARGHEVVLAVLDSRAGGKRRWLTLARRALAAARRQRPDVIHAHFLFPTGLIAELTRAAPVVVTAHGQDVANVGAIRGVRAATRFVVRNAAEVVAVSEFLRRQLEERVPEMRGATVAVIDSGVDLERFAPQDQDAARAALDWDGDGPAYLCVGGLTERKNVVRLASAFGRLGRGRLAFVGDGPLRGALSGRPGVRVVGAVRHADVPHWVSAADVVCQPSLVEPFGQALLEAMAAGRSVVATRIGGPPEFVTPQAGVLVDPLDEAAIASGLERAAELPSPNDAARTAAAQRDVRLQAERLEAVLERAVRGRRA